MTREFDVLFELAYKANTVVFVLSVVSLVLSSPGSGGRVISTMAVVISLFTYLLIYVVLRRRG